MSTAENQKTSITVTLTREQAQAALTALEASRLGPAWPTVAACEAAQALAQALRS